MTAHVALPPPIPSGRHHPGDRGRAGRHGPLRTVLVRWVLPLVLPVLAGLLAPPPEARAQGLELAVGGVGLGLGDVPRLDGIRLNFRDRALQRIRGLNLTIREPHDSAAGVVRGVALGLPMTGAAEITGLGLGAGVGVGREFTGIGLAPVGFGAGGRIRGIAVGGLGVGGGGGLDGVMIGGVGLGAGGDIRGLVVGGVGAGAGGSLKGVAVGGVGVGAGGDLTGVAVGGVGVGAGGDVTGIILAGAGIGAGGHLKGLSVAGGGVGAPRITGAVLTGFGAGGRDVTGLVLAPGYFRIAEGGRFRGVSLSAWNRIDGRQHGLVIGLLNVAEELHGLQIGVLNIARNKESFSVLPLVNWSR